MTVQNQNPQAIVTNIVQRNEAICTLLNFKQYIPNSEVAEAYLKTKPILLPSLFKWYVVPGLGNYNNYELRFNSDWNWLMDATLQIIAKHKNTHKAGSTLKDKFEMFSTCNLNSMTKMDLWLRLSDYALAITSQNTAA